MLHRSHAGDRAAHADQKRDGAGNAAVGQFLFDGRLRLRQPVRGDGHCREVLLGKADGPHVETELSHNLAGFAKNKLRAAAAGIHRHQIGLSGPFDARHHRHIGKLRFFLAGKHAQFHAAEFFDAGDEIRGVPCNAQSHRPHGDDLVGPRRFRLAYKIRHGTGVALQRLRADAPSVFQTFAKTGNIIDVLDDFVTAGPGAFRQTELDRVGADVDDRFS